MDSRLVEWAAGESASLLRGVGSRLEHSAGVGKRALQVAPHLPNVADREALVAAALLHDIGHAPALAVTGFNPLDGARHLRQLGHERLANLVAHHFGARSEAAIRGLAVQLAAFPREESAVADALTFCDVTTGPHGDPVSFEERCDDVRRRYPVGSAVREGLRLAPL